MIHSKRRIYLLLSAFISYTLTCNTYATGMQSMNNPNEGESTIENTEIASIDSIDEKKVADKNVNVKDTATVKKPAKMPKQNKEVAKEKGTETSKDLKKVIKTLNDSIVVKDSQLKLLQADIDSLKRDLDELIPFKIELLRNLSKNSDLETLPFSAVSLTKIDSVRNKLRPFLSYSPDLTEKDARLAKLSERKKIFDNFSTSIGSIPYGGQLKKEYQIFHNEFSSGLSDIQKSEVNELEQWMSAYPALVPEFVKVTDEFKLQLEYARNANDLQDAKDMARETIKMNDNFDSAKVKMKHIPYMDSLLEEYLELLAGNNPLDKRILEIETSVDSMDASLKDESTNK